MRSLHEQYKAYVNEVRQTPGKHWVNESTFIKMYREEFNKNVVLPEPRHWETKETENKIDRWINDTFEVCPSAKMDAKIPYRMYCEDFGDEAESETKFGRHLNKLSRIKTMRFDDGKRGLGRQITLKQ